ncbi:RNA pyrophosphohydrolase [Glacieibacterium frigidum]|uniref:RNA pyrophosphohydrolase n=1 Tax=Glacieibacterium frigidum TaxID=2593303 RepID=A0A552UFJ9_9SPHN|nr:RNA pyrophosphohydrolase [Glacieibacterium frigidum]TRW16995.1 RNA pyrophosphohydrolase [Glacieibacterium frigidum]
MTDRIHTSGLPYRAGVGIMLLNEAGKVFVGQRLDSTLEAWQMPQGGIDAGETPREAALRELTEETGVPAALVEVLQETDDWLYYDLPADLIGTVWKGRYCGQRQKWFAMRFLGTDADVRIDTEHAEFRAWQWADRDQLDALIVPFKRDLYSQVLEALS